MTPCTLALLVPLMGLPLDVSSAAQDLARPQEPQPVRVALASQELRLELYDVADLNGLDEVRELSAQVSDLIKGGIRSLSDLQAKQEELSVARARAEEEAPALADALKLHMQPSFVVDRNSLVVLDNGHLVLSASPQQHAWVSAFLAFQREPQGLILIKAQVLTVPQGTLARLGLKGSAKIFEETEVFEALLEKVIAAGPEVEVLTAPKILTYPRQKATISILTQVAYVKDYTLEIVQPGDVEIADPVIEVIQEGVIFNVRVIPLAPGIYGVEVDLTQSTILRPLRTVKILIGAARHEVSITLPEVHERGLETHLTMSNGGAAIFVSPDLEDDRDLVVTLRIQQMREGDRDLPGTDASSRKGGK